MLKKTSRLDHSENARLERVEQLRSKTGKSLSALSLSYLNSTNVVGNIENFLGSVAIPLGFAGPLKINFKEGSEEIFAPFATSEGALISSVSRGCLALNLSGGVKVRYLENRVLRAPAFLFDNIDDALNFQNWLKGKSAWLKQKVSETSRFATLTEIDTKLIVQEVHVLFSFSTGNAAGQNMTTFISWNLMQSIRQQYYNENNIWLENFIIEGNLASDKKATGTSISQGRGRKVIVEAKIPAAVVKKIFKTEAQTLCQSFNRMKSARVLAGYQGFNINVANAVAAIFIATGQDAASIHESSVAELHMEILNGDLFVSLYMPSLMLGTRGGGTHLPHAKNCLELMGCDEHDGAEKLAQIIGAFALSLELSTVSAIRSGAFVEAHYNLGRDHRRVFYPRDLTPDFFNSRLLQNERLFTKFNSIQMLSIDDAMMMDMSSMSSRRCSGLFQIEASHTSTATENSTSAGDQTETLLLKVKTNETDLIQASKMMLDLLEMESISQIPEFKSHHPFFGCQKNEILINRFLQTEKVDFSPAIWFSEMHEDLGLILFEQFAQCEKKFNGWKKDEVDHALDILRRVHLLQPRYAGGISYSDDYFTESKNLWVAIAVDLRNKSNSFQKPLAPVFDRLIANYDDLFRDFAKMPKYFCHLDFNPRNILFDQNNEMKVIDWEFSSFFLPQRDLLEFLAFIAHDLSDNQILNYMNDYQEKIKSDEKLWQAGLQMGLADFCLRRLSLYLIVNEFKKIHFLETVARNVIRLNSLIQKTHANHRQ